MRDSLLKTPHDSEVRENTETKSATETQRHRAKSDLLCVSVSLWLVLLCVLCPLGVSIASAAAPRRLRRRSSRRSPARSKSSGLAAPVRIVRDTWGVPHIYAQNEDDLFFAQGFVQAQDRLFQMDLWRRSAQGRLSRGPRPEFHRARRDDAPHAVPRRPERRVGELRSGRARDRQRPSCAASTPGSALARDRPPEEFVARRLETGGLVAGRSAESHGRVHRRAATRSTRCAAGT